MSERLPVVSGDEAVGAFCRSGYEVTRQKGSHARLRDPQRPERSPISIPRHAELKPGLLRRLIRDASLSVDDFRRLIG